MELHEHEGKALLAQYGLPVPRGEAVPSPDAAVSAARRLGYPVMLKAQIAGGGRGRAGKIIQAENDAEVRAEAVRLLGGAIGSHGGESLLVEEYVAAARELYLSYVLDPDIERLLLMFGLHGGVDVEAQPTDRMLRLPVAVRTGPDFETLRRFVTRQGDPEIADALVRLAGALYESVRRADLLLAEINPLLVLGDGRLVAADARIEVDENALFRQENTLALYEAREDRAPREVQAQKLGLNEFVELGGEVGIVANGAGLGMATMDLLQAAGLRPANFLETGGRITADLVRGALELVLDQPGIRGVLVNLYGGINPMIDAARGLVAALEARDVGVPVVVRLRGNEQEAAWSVLERAGVETERSLETAVAVRTLARLLEART